MSKRPHNKQSRIKEECIHTRRKQQNDTGKVSDLFSVLLLKKVERGKATTVLAGRMNSRKAFKLLEKDSNLTLKKEEAGRGHTKECKDLYCYI